jgi:hypothetical protein
LVLELFLIHSLIIDPRVFVVILDEVIGLYAIDGCNVVLEIFLLVVLGLFLLEVFLVDSHASRTGNLESDVL